MVMIYQYSLHTHTHTHTHRYIHIYIEHMIYVYDYVYIIYIIVVYNSPLLPTKRKIVFVCNIKNFTAAFLVFLEKAAINNK